MESLKARSSNASLRRHICKTLLVIAALPAVGFVPKKIASDDCGGMSPADCVICCEGDENCSKGCPDELLLLVLSAFGSSVTSNGTPYWLENAQGLLDSLVEARNSGNTQFFVDSLLNALHADGLGMNVRSRVLDPFIILSLLDVLDGQAEGAQIARDALAAWLLANGQDQATDVGKLGICGLAAAFEIPETASSCTSEDPLMTEAILLFAELSKTRGY